jgi:hypothetical protein
LASFFSDQDIRIRHICTARQVEADERDLARTVGDIAFTGSAQEVQVLRQVSERVAWIQEWSNATHRVSRARQETLRQELAPRDRTRMIGVKQRQIPVAFVSFHGHL